MSTPTLASVATRTVGQYGQLGKLIVDGYRRGARRLARGANDRYEAFLDKRQLPLMNEVVKGGLIFIERGVVAIVEEGVVRGSDRAEQVIGRLAEGVTRGIRRVADTAARVEAAFETKAISKVSGFTIPAANASLELSSLALEGTKLLSARVAEGTTQTVKTSAKTAPVAKKAVRKAKTRA